VGVECGGIDRGRHRRGWRRGRIGTDEDRGLHEDKGVEEGREQVSASVEACTRVEEESKSTVTL